MARTLAAASEAVRTAGFFNDQKQISSDGPSKGILSVDGVVCCLPQQSVAPSSSAMPDSASAFISRLKSEDSPKGWPLIPADLQESGFAAASYASLE